GTLRRGAEVVRQSGKDRLEVSAFKEPLPDVVFFQPGDMGRAGDPLRLQGEVERPFQHSEFTVDLRVAGFLVEPLGDEGLHVGGPDVVRFLPAEERSKVQPDAPRYA